MSPPANLCLYISKASETLRKHFSWKSQKGWAAEPHVALVLPAQPLALAQNVHERLEAQAIKVLKKYEFDFYFSK